MEITLSELCSESLFFKPFNTQFLHQNRETLDSFNPFPIEISPVLPLHSLSPNNKRTHWSKRNIGQREKLAKEWKEEKGKPIKPVSRMPEVGEGRKAAEGRQQQGARGRARKDGARRRGIKKKREEVYPRRGVEGREAGRAGRASVHGRATHARSIKRAFTIDQRSIEVDHELKTVVTREARRPRQLFARLCKYLAAERRTRRWAPLGWGAVHARPPPSNLRSSVHEIRSTRVYVLRTYVRT